ncbi:uncharacterized protein ACRADG_011694 [Cochliomyia hominivorax]
MYKMEHVKFWKEFFKLYEEMPALWRVKCAAYSDRVQKAECYAKLVKKLQQIYPDADRELVVRKINNFRTSYRKEIKRLKKCKEAGKFYKSTLWYFDCLTFLNEQYDFEGLACASEEDTTEESKQNNKNSDKIPNYSKLKRGPDKRDNMDEQNLSNSSKPPPPKKSHQSYDDKLQAKMDSDILAKSWALQYRDMANDQKLIARKLISDIIFHGCLDQLNMSHVIEFQEIFSKNFYNQNFHVRPQSTEESTSSVACVEQDDLNYDGFREPSINYNSSSPASSPLRKTIMEIHVDDVKFEVSDV